MSSTDFAKRYKKKIASAGIGCWLWVGSKSKAGYGVIRLHKKLIFAHRVSLYYCGRTVPAGMVTDHLCRNKACVNPEHLEVVTQKINSMRGNRSLKKERCKRGHPLSDGNIYSWREGAARSCRKCTLQRSAKRYQRIKESRAVID